MHKVIIKKSKKSHKCMSIKIEGLEENVEMAEEAIKQLRMGMKQ